MHKTIKGTLWVLHSALNTFSLLLLSCQVVTRATRFSPWKPSSWSCCLYSRLFWALCLRFPGWNSIWIFWHQQSQSPCHHSLQALKWRNGWFSEYRGGTCNLQKAFVCHFLMMWHKIMTLSFTSRSWYQSIFKTLNALLRTCMNSLMDVQDSTRADTILVTSPVPWLILDIQSKETSLPLHMLKENRVLLAHM